MQGKHELADLAPRDIVTREIIREMRRTGRENVFLDVSSMTEEFFAKRFPTIYGECVKSGVAVPKDMIPVRPSQHYLMGGIRTDLDGRTNVEGLYAYADSLGVEIRVTNQLTISGKCTDEVYQEQKVDSEKVTPITVEHWKKKRGITPDQVLPKQSIRPVPPDPNAVGIKCNAGKNTCFVRHDGKMLGCNMLDAFTVDTHDRPLTECFAELNNWAKSLQRIKECEGCIHAIHCTTCVAAHYADTKQIGIPSPKLCFKVLQPEKARQEQEFFDKHGYLEV